MVVVRRDRERFWFGDLGDADVEQLAAWIESPQDVMPIGDRVFGGPAGRSRRRLMPERGGDLAAALADLVRSGGAWTMGVPGAIAEYAPGGGADLVAVRTSHDADHVVATTDAGSMRIEVTGATRAFAFGRDGAPEEPELYTVVRTGQALPARSGVTELGPDPDPIDDSADGVLFDLGMGRSAASFMVRTRDRGLIAQLRAVSGTPLQSIDTSVWRSLVEASPTRVVRMAVGRIEVHSPIPPPGGVSPDGCHTHLLPETLVAGLDLPAGIDVPDGWRLGPLHYPRDAAG
ncbi:MAG: hypothetical protein AAGA90_01730 [Actinomycetota bacterium]